jgi:hypothetical protein
MKFKEIPPHTLITGVAGIAWLGSFVVRAIKPDFALGAAADALMTTVVGYWFTAEHKSGGNDLLNEVVSKVGIPYISTAHKDKTPPPRPSVPPKPAAPKKQPKQGGLPWS